MALYSQYESGLQLTAGILAGSTYGTSGLNPIADRINSISPAGSQISGAQLSIYGNFAGLVAGNGIDITNGSEIVGEASSTTNAGIIEVATSAETQTGTDATRAVSPDSLFDTTPPVGAIIAWAKTIAGIPQALPTSWLECDGSVVSDGASPINGQNVPDLTNSEFLRGNSTSGSTGGGTTGAGSSHTHTQDGSVSNHTSLSLNTDQHNHSFSDTSSTPSQTAGVPQGEGGTVTFGSQFHTHDVSGNTGNDTHGHTFSQNISNHSDTFSNANESSHTHSSQPKFYDVVWIIRIK